jgi:LmbE family N-acetylglucosaminyl deacetylase
MPDRNAPMREWGRVEATELERVVVISPHLDDAVLGCGALLATQPGATVITVFAAGPVEYPDPPTPWDSLAGFSVGDDVLGARRQEDAAALAAVGADPVWLDYTEHQYLDRPDWLGAAAVVDGLEASVRVCEPTLVLMPFGLANPDHDATHQAALLVRERMPGPAWFCYEETGYKHIPGLLAWRVAQLFRRGIWPTPVAIAVADGSEAKSAALTCYRSQLLALEADWQLGEKLASPEQYWRLAPPPPGWEGLSADGGSSGGT